MTDDEMTLIMDRIDAWHEADTELGLHEWLGWTLQEYAMFVRCTGLERP